MKRAGLMGLGVIGLGIAAVVFFTHPFSPDAPQAIGNDSQESVISQTTDAYSITVTTPRVRDEQTKAVVQFSISQQNQFVVDAQQAHNLYEAEEDPAYPWQAHSLTINYEKYETGGYVSYVVNEYLFTGGANGTQLVTSFNYAPDGKRITLADVVPEDLRNQLMETLRVRLYSVNDIEASDTGVFAESIRELTFENLENFYLSDTDLVLAFQEYDVAPGAAGAVRIGLPRSSYTQLHNSQ